MSHQRREGESDHDFLSRIAPDYRKIWQEKVALGSLRSSMRAANRRMRTRENLRLLEETDLTNSAHKQVPDKSYSLH